LSFGCFARSSAQHATETCGCETRKHLHHVLCPHMIDEDFGEHVSEVGSEREIAAFIQLFGSKAGPSAIHLPAFDTATSHEETTGVSVIRAAGAILAHGAAELRHGENDDVMHPVAKVVVEGRETIPKIL